MPDVPPRLSSLTTAYPGNTFAQATVRDLAKQHIGIDAVKEPDLANAIDHLFAATGVEQRQSAIDYGDYYQQPRTTGDRMASYRHLAYDLGRAAVAGALAESAPWLGPGQLTDLTVVSCTGYSAPGLDIQLARDLGLARDVRRTVVGHMGCFGALVGLRQALAAVRGYPGAVALVLCVELTSLHFMPTRDLEVLTSFALFGDAAAAFVLTTHPDATGPEVIATFCAADFAAADQMSWTITDTGFVMELSPRVPASLRRTIGPVIDQLLTPHGLDRHAIKHWIIHPGGPSILDAIQRKLELSDAQMAPAWAVLRRYGNCSSATVLAVLRHLIDSGAPQPGDWGVMMAFGPGLTLETALVRF